MTRSDAFELGPGLPAVLLRAVIALVCGGLVLILANTGIGGPVLVVLGLGAVMSVVMPASPAPALVLALVAMSVVAARPDPFAVEVLVLVPLVHLLHVGCGIAGLVPLRSRVHLAALRAPAVRFVAIQAGVFALVGVMALAPAGRPPAVLELGALLGVAVLAALVAALLSRA